MNILGQITRGGTPLNVPNTNVRRDATGAAILGALTLAGALLFAPDAIGSIGQPGALRPASVYVADSIVVGADPTGAERLRITGDVKIVGTLTATTLVGAVAPASLTGFGAAGGYLRSDGVAWVRVSGLAVADLTGTTLPVAIVTSSLTSVGTLGSLNVVSGALAENAHALAVSGTLNASATDQYGTFIYITSAGGAAGSPYAFRVDLESGYTGSAKTYAARFVNRADGTFSTGSGGNIAVEGVAHGSGAAASVYVNVGMGGQARWAPLSIGLRGLGVHTNGITERLGQTSVGVYGRGTADATGVQIGAVFIVGGGDPYWGPASAIIGDSGATATPVFLGRYNVTNYFTAVVSSAGLVTLAATGASAAWTFGAQAVTMGALSATTVTASALIQGTVADAAVGLKLLGASGKLNVYPYYNSTFGVILQALTSADAAAPMSYSASVHKFYAGTIEQADTTDSSSSTTGALKTAGGLGVAKAIYGGSNIYAVTAYYVGVTKVLGAQGAAVADASGGSVIDAEARTAINTLLARCRSHGLIAT